MKLKKYLGQHLLRDLGIVKFMVRKAKVCSKDTILEIGPGTGAVTNELLNSAKKVIAVETDPKMIVRLEEKFNAEIESGRLEIINSDVINFLNAKDSLPEKYKVVASLPYNIGTLIIRTLLEHREVKPEIIVVLLQLEVAQRMSAKEGRRYLLSNAVQYYADAEIIKIVPPTKFLPPPKVNSAVLKIDNIQEKDRDEAKKFFRVVKVAFSNPRKTILNNLKAGLPELEKETILECLKKSGVDHGLRSERLNLEEMKELASEITNLL